jgi:type IV secretory pathway TrbD component
MGMVDQVFALLGWIAAFGVVIWGVIALVARFVSRDSTQYDMVFLWDNRFTLEELELDEPA